MGGIANMAPELYKGIVAHVPFVDVVTTMLDLGGIIEFMANLGNPK